MKKKKFKALDARFLIPELLDHGFTIDPLDGELYHPTLDNDFAERQYRDAWYRASVKAKDLGFGHYEYIAAGGMFAIYHPFSK